MRSCATPVFIPNLRKVSLQPLCTPKHAKRKGLQLMCSAIHKVTIKNKACASFCRKPEGMEEHEQVPQLAVKIALGFAGHALKHAVLLTPSCDCCMLFQQTKDSTIVTCTIGDSKPTEDGSKDSTWLRGLNNRLILSYNPTCTASQNHQAVGVICTLGDTIAQKIRKSQTSSPSNKPK